jgi:hypothetical protein
MPHKCGACNGTGDCHDDFHSGLNQTLADSIKAGTGLSDDCPACGKEAGYPGKCSVCGGSGEQDD